MSQKTGKKIGLIGALSMLIGSVVGIGIFFKSHGILRANDWNGIGTLLAWVIGGLLSLTAAISFSEIGSLKTKRVAGFSGWSEIVGGKKFGYFIRFNYSFFYYTILNTVLGIFGSEILFKLICSLSSGEYQMKDFPIYSHIIIGIGLVVFFQLFNHFSVRGGGIFQTVSTILKWVPLIVVGFVGVIFATTNYHPNSSPKVSGAGFQNYFGVNTFTNGSSLSFAGMIAALPAVLFAFDAFLGVGAMKNKMKKPEKIPMVVIVGMVSVIVLYLLIALAAILHGSGMVSGFGKPEEGLGIFDQVFPTDIASAMGKFTMTFLMISTLGVINGISASAITVSEQALETNTIFGAKTLRSKIGDTKTLIVYMIGIIVFWGLVMGIPAIILDSDAIIDGVSNFPTLFMFAFYAIVILLYTLQRDKMTTSKKINNTLFKISAWIAIIGILTVIGITMFHVFLMAPLQTITSGNLEESHWGLFATNGHGMNTVQGLIVFFSMLTAFISLPFINKALTKKFEKNDVIIDTLK